MKTGQKTRYINADMNGFFLCLDKVSSPFGELSRFVHRLGYTIYEADFLIENRRNTCSFLLDFWSTSWYNKNMKTNNTKLIHGRTSVYNLNYHIVWCTKYRNKVLHNPISKDLKDILVGIAEESKYKIAHIEIGLDNHIHLLVSAPPKKSVSTIVKQLKGVSSLHLFAKYPELKRWFWKEKSARSFWSPSYYVESIGSVNEEAIARYINDQRKKV
jgi:putative transposase